MKKLTATQEKLMSHLGDILLLKHHLPLETLKRRCSHIKSFDSTFNALYEKGYLERHETNDYSNQFKLSAGYYNVK